jgi:molecular chaperone DnaJ
MSNYYDVLGVDKNATKDDIKKAFRKKAVEHHPDKGGDESKFKEASEAYEILSDDEKRRNYDNFGTNGNPFGGGGRQQSHGFSMDDIFSQFGDIFGGGRQRQRVRRGGDLRVQISVTLEEVIMGCKKKLKYNRQKPCNSCNSKGGTDLKSCNICGGSGQRTMSQQTPFGTISQSVPCNNCSASGQVISNPCKSCGGNGTVLEEEITEVDLPKGVSSGMNLTMGGYGNHIRDGQPGDLQILIDEVTHNKFMRDGNDLYCDEWISIPDAVLGTKIDIPTIQGDVRINVEPGCESGRVFTIQGKGTPVLLNNGKVYGNGNLYIKVNITIPKKISDNERELYNKLR